MAGLSPNALSILAMIEQLPETDRAALQAALTTNSSEQAVLDALEGLMGADRRCPHCATPGAEKRGKAAKLIRYHCKACGKFFNALTGTPLAKLKCREKWLDMAESLSQGESLTECQERCGIARKTALRWRHRMLGTAARRTKSTKLGGTTEMDTTFVRESRKGSRKPEEGKKPRKRGGPIGGGKLLPVLMAVQRGGDMMAALLRSEAADAVRYAIGDALARGAVIVTDSAKNFGRTFRRMGVHHEKVNIAKHQRVRGPYHIQTINGLHARFKQFMARFNGVATKYLPNYLEWFRTVEFGHCSARLSCFSAVMAGGVQAGCAH